MEKWTGDLAPPPFWLVPSLEVTSEQDAPKLPRGKFVLACLAALLAQHLSLDLALGVAANTMNETGWGRYYHGDNLGGWKINKGTAHNPDGSPRRWWRALGNKGSGDPQTCFYRAFPSFEAYFAEWLANFVPKQGKPKGRYTKTGQQFWAGEPWFDDLIEAGYKGEVTRRNPSGSIHAHDQIVKTLLVYWVQSLLGVASDGQWGPKSKAACAGFQESVGLKATGVLDDATIKLLTDEGAPKMTTMVLPLLAKNHDPELSEAA